MYRVPLKAEHLKINSHSCRMKFPRQMRPHRKFTGNPAVPQGDKHRVTSRKHYRSQWTLRPL